MRSQREGIGAAIAAALVIIVVIVGIAGYLSFAPRSSTDTPVTLTGVVTTVQNDFNLEGPVPLVTISPQNNTFRLTYNATTLGMPVTGLSFSLNQSWAMIYTNGTEWTNSPQACSSSLEQSTSSSTNATSQTSSRSDSTTTITVTVSRNLCYNPPGQQWASVNGSVVDQNARFNSSQVELSVLPITIAANQTVSLQFTITVNLKPGTYAIGLALDVQTTDYSESSYLNTFPVVVKS